MEALLDEAPGQGTGGAGPDPAGPAPDAVALAAQQQVRLATRLRAAVSRVHRRQALTVLGAPGFLVPVFAVVAVEEPLAQAADGLCVAQRVPSRRRRRRRRRCRLSLLLLLYQEFFIRIWNMGGFFLGFSAVLCLKTFYAFKVLRNY